MNELLEKHKCKVCDGAGKLAVVDAHGETVKETVCYYCVEGMEDGWDKCFVCKGTGAIGDRACHLCNGDGCFPELPDHERDRLLSQPEKYKAAMKCPTPPP